MSFHILNNANQFFPKRGMKNEKNYWIYCRATICGPVAHFGQSGAQTARTDGTDGPGNNEQGPVDEHIDGYAHNANERISVSFKCGSS